MSGSPPGPAQRSQRNRASARGFSLARFIRERQGRWDELERLLERFSESTARELGRHAVIDLIRLYRLACSDINQARSYTANADLLGNLNRMIGRAYRIVYQAAAGPMWRWSVPWRFLAEEVPATFRSMSREVLIAAMVFLAGAVFGLAAVISDPSSTSALLPAQFFTESPAERVHHIESSPERISNLKEAAGFATMLFTHNIQVSFLVLGLGALTIIGGWMLLFYQGVLLGVVGGSYVIDGVGTFFLAWVGPHGALEIPAIIIATTAGVRLGRALLVPGEEGRTMALRLAAGPVYRMTVTSMLCLVGAGLIEGSFSQFSAKSVPYAIKIAVAVLLLSGLWWWLFAPRRQELARG